MTAHDEAVNAARKAFVERIGHRLTVDEQIAFGVALEMARAGGAIFYRDDVDALRTASHELLDAEEAYRFAPTLENTSRLARARRAVERAADTVGVSANADADRATP
jgi:hypothetical protein